MHSKAVERVVVAQTVLQLHSGVADRACEESDEEGTGRVDVPRSGVIATSPATAPLTIPSRLGRLRTYHSVSIHERAATAAAI